MSDIQRQQEIMADLDQFFQAAIPDDDYNAVLAQPYIQKWNMLFLHMSLAWFVMKLKQVTGSTMMFFSATLEAAGDEMIRDEAVNWIAFIASLTNAYGHAGPAYLGNVVANATDEDTIALAAFLLSAEDFADKSRKDLFWRAYKKAEGTSCKIALAFALHIIGEKRELEGFIKKGYFGSQKAIDTVKNMIKNANPRISRQDLDDMVMNAILFPYMIPVKTSIMVFPGILGLLALDIGSNGHAFARMKDWKRKQYT